MNYFPHYINTQRDIKIVKLKRALGMTGYGVFWALLEMEYETNDCELDLDLDSLAALLGVDEPTLKSVVYDFNLFTVDEARGVFYSEAAKEYVVEYEKKLDDYKEKRSELARKSAEARWSKHRAKKGQAGNTPKTPDNAAHTKERQIIQGKVERREKTPETRANEEILNDEELRADEPSLAETIIALWNGIFEGTRQAYRGLTLDSISYENARKALDDGYTLEEMGRAFQFAKNDAGFGWRLKDALKPDNIQLLLIKGERKQNERQGGSGSNGSDNTGSVPDPNGWDAIDFTRFTRNE